MIYKFYYNFLFLAGKEHTFIKSEHFVTKRKVSWYYMWR